jgi:hypothetical protein
MELDVAAEIGVDLATKADLETLVRRLEEKYKQQILAADSRVTDATGKCGFRVYDIPDGMQFYPSRYIVWSDAHVPSTAGCFQSTSCYGGIYHGLPSPINIADYFPPPSGGISESATPNIIPYYKEFNRHDSPEFQAPDNVYFSLINGPISTNVTCILYGWLEELREGRSAQFRVKRSRMHHRRRGTPTPVLAGHDSDATLG